MKVADYVKQSQRTEKDLSGGLKLNGEQAQLLHASMGLVTESGELQDVVKKNLIYGKAVDWVNVMEEIGDIMWYVAIILRIRGVTLQQVMEANIEKLKVRFPEKFTEVDALVRNLDNERNRLEKDLND